MRCKNKKNAAVREFIFFTRACKSSEIFTHYCYENTLFCPNFLEVLELHKYGQCSDCYRLSCLRQILFLMHCFACFDETINCISGISHGEVMIQ